MKRSGFTMIELVFIVVIIGILAAVAVPRLAASRNDAAAATVKTDIGTAVQAIPAGYMADNNASILRAGLDNAKWTVTDQNRAAYRVGTAECVVIAVVKGERNMTLTEISALTIPAAGAGSDASFTNGEIWPVGSSVITNGTSTLVPWLFIGIADGNTSADPTTGAPVSGMTLNTGAVCRALTDMKIKSQIVSIAGTSINFNN